MSHFGGHLVSHVLGALIGRAIRDAKPERRGQTTFVRFENQDQVGQLAQSPVEVEDPQNPTCCSCFGLKSTIKTFCYVQIVLLVLGVLSAGLAIVLLTTGDGIHPWYHLPVAGAAYVVLLWVSGLYITAAVLLVRGVNRANRGLLRVWMWLNISGLVTSIILHSLAATVVFQAEYYSHHAILGMMIQTLVCHVIWVGFVVLVGKLNRLMKDGDACQTRTEQRSMHMSGLPHTQDMTGLSSHGVGSMDCV